MKTGGRGRGVFENGFKGGVHCVNDDDNEALRIIQNMLGSRIITAQTGSEGELCRSVMLCEWFEMEAEKYLSFMIDSARQCPVIMFNGQGGGSIESSDQTQKVILFGGKYLTLQKNY